MPGRDVQTIQKLLVHQLVRPEKGHVDDVVHLVPVDRFGFQYKMSKRFVEESYISIPFIMWAYLLTKNLKTFSRSHIL